MIKRSRFCQQRCISTERQKWNETWKYSNHQGKPQALSHLPGGTSETIIFQNQIAMIWGWSTFCIQCCILISASSKIMRLSKWEKWWEWIVTYKLSGKFLNKPNCICKQALFPIWQLHNPSIFNPINLLWLWHPHCLPPVAFNQARWIL